MVQLYATIQLSWIIILIHFSNPNSLSVIFGNNKSDNGYVRMCVSSVVHRYKAIQMFGKNFEAFFRWTLLCLHLSENVSSCSYNRLEFNLHNIEHKSKHKNSALL